MNALQDWKSIGWQWLRLLTFRASLEDYESLGLRHLVAGVMVTWLVGMGRYWDDPRAGLLQHLGLGSVIYIFVLSVLLWWVFKPMNPERFSYVRIVTFVSLTSPPAALYAIPIELWVDLPLANRINLWFLAVVALWRVALMVHYLVVQGQLRAFQTFACATTPLAVIFLALGALNLHHVVFDIMGGIREADQSSQDAAFMALWVLAYFSVPVSVIAGLVWLVCVGRRLHEERSGE